MMKRKGRTPIPAEQRFWAKVKTTEGDECWEWQASKNPAGYGQFVPHMGSRPLLAHRYSYECKVGVIPEGVFVLHKCDNRACVKPDHLFLGTNKDNVEDMISKGRHCFGERNGASKINEESVVNIRQMYSKGDVTQREIAVIFGITVGQVSNIVLHKRWGHVE
jgi:hypothetical protein